MMKDRINVLYICHDRVLMAGAVYSLINLMEATKTVVNPIVLIRKGVVKDELQSRGYECITFPYQLNLRRKIKSPYIRHVRQILDDVINIVCVYYTKFMLKNRNVAIVHSNSSSVSIGPMIAKKLGAKHVWHIREFLDLDFGTSPSKGWQNLYDFIYKADYVIAITNAVFEHWHLERCIRSKVLYNAVRSINDVQLVESKEKYFLFCSTSLNDYKGADFAVTLFCKSCLYKEGYRLKLIGRYEREYKNKLDIIAMNYQQDPFIDYLGFQDDIKQYMLKASALLMCSLNEAMGRVTVEALFYGCPVLGHNTGGTKEILIDGENGYLYNNIDEALTKLRRIVECPQETSRIIRNGIESAKNNFSKEFYGDKILEIYNCTLNEYEK